MWNGLFWTGRILFAAIFIMSGLNHFMQAGAMTQYAESKGLPAPRFMVLFSGAMILAGGLSVLLWQYVVYGAGLLFVFLLVAAFTMHDFWAIEDEQQKQNEMTQFMKNLSLSGAALILYVLAQVPDPNTLF